MRTRRSAGPLTDRAVVGHRVLRFRAGRVHDRGEDGDGAADDPVGGVVRVVEAGEKAGGAEDDAADDRCEGGGAVSGCGEPGGGVGGGDDQCEAEVGQHGSPLGAGLFVVVVSVP